MFPHLDDSSPFQSSESSWFWLAFVAFQFRQMWSASSWQESTYLTQQAAASHLSSWLSWRSCVVRSHRKLPSMGFLKRQVFTLSPMAQNIPKLPSSLIPTPSYFDPLSNILYHIPKALWLPIIFYQGTEALLFLPQLQYAPGTYSQYALLASS